MLHNHNPAGALWNDVIIVFWKWQKLKACFVIFAMEPGRSGYSAQPRYIEHFLLTDNAFLNADLSLILIH